RFSRDWSSDVCSSDLGAVSAVLMAVLYTPGEDATRVYYGTDTRLFGLMIGVALAFTWASPRSWLHSPAWLRWRQPAALAAFAGRSEARGGGDEGRREG